MALAGYCLDTDILIDYLRGLEDARAFLLEASNQTSLFISAISVTEVYSGQMTRNASVKKSLASFFKNFHIISLTPDLALKAGELRHDYQRPFADMIIAASALDNKLMLVTRNERHFRDITGLKLHIPY